MDSADCILRPAVRQNPYEHGLKSASKIELDTSFRLPGPPGRRWWESLSFRISVLLLRSSPASSYANSPVFAAKSLDH